MVHQIFIGLRNCYLQPLHGCINCYNIVTVVRRAKLQNLRGFSCGEKGMPFTSPGSNDQNLFFVLKLVLTGGCCPDIFGQPSHLHRIAHFWRKCGSPFANQKKRWYLGMNGQRLWLAIAGQMFWWKGKLSNQCVAIDLYLCNNISIHTTFHWVVSMLSPFPKILVVTGKGDNPI